MPVILIDISRLLYRRMAGRLPTGVDRVSVEYLRHYLHEARAVLSLAGFHAVLPRRTSEQAFRLILDQSRHPHTEWLFILRLIVAVYIGIWTERKVEGAILFNTGHMGLSYDKYARGLCKRGVRPVFMVHDLIPITHPEYCRPRESERHHRRMRNVLRLAHGILANSDATRTSLAAFAEKLSLPMPLSIVAPLAPGLLGVAPGPRPIREPYFVVLSTIEPRKNHLLLLHLWRRLREEMGDSAPRLVIVGQRGWECENVVDLLERSELLRGFVFEFSNCSDSDLATYLHYAQSLLFPSFVEGYGMPLIEALAAGVPVIASDLAVFREFATDIPDYADPLDPQRWLALIRDYASPTSDKRAAQIARMKAFEVPTWGQHFARLDLLLARLSDSGRKPDS